MKVLCWPQLLILVEYTEKHANRAGNLSQLAFDFSESLTYRLKVSARSRRASLRVEPGCGLIVTIPVNFPKHRVPDFVEKNRAWVEKALADIERQTPECCREWPPRLLDLKAANKIVQLVYSDTDDLRSQASISRQSTDISADTTIVQWKLIANPHDKAAVSAEVAARLVAEAKLLLTPLTASLACLHEFNYWRVSIRGQRSLWGSCSTSGTISLNYKLLFLDRPLVNYVLLHELAHTVHADHSTAFWGLLCSLDVNARVRHKQLRVAGRNVPPWLAGRAVN